MRTGSIVSTVLALTNSRFKRAMKSMLIPLGQTASHSPWFEQLPKPSRSIAWVIRRARCFLSGWPCGRRLRWETLAAVNSIADPFGQAATHAAHPIHAAASMARSETSLAIGMELASDALPVRAEMKPPACWIRSKAVLSTTRSLITGRAPERKGSTTTVAPSRNSRRKSWQAVVSFRGP